MRENIFTDWESVFACVVDDKIIGFCTFLKSDYYPENRYSSWISTIFVDEKFRGQRISLEMIELVINYAKENSFSKVYIPSGVYGLYEKYGFIPIDKLVNYRGDTDTVFMRKI